MSMRKKSNIIIAAVLSVLMVFWVVHLIKGTEAESVTLSFTNSGGTNYRIYMFIAGDEVQVSFESNPDIHLVEIKKVEGGGHVVLIDADVKNADSYELNETIHIKYYSNRRLREAETPTITEELRQWLEKGGYTRSVKGEDGLLYLYSNINTANSTAEALALAFSYYHGYAITNWQISKVNDYKLIALMGAIVFIAMDNFVPGDRRRLKRHLASLAEVKEKLKSHPKYEEKLAKAKINYDEYIGKKKLLNLLEVLVLFILYYVAYINVSLLFASNPYIYRISLILLLLTVTFVIKRIYSIFYSKLLNKLTADLLTECDPITTFLSYAECFDNNYGIITMEGNWYYLMIASTLQWMGEAEEALAYANCLAETTKKGIFRGFDTISYYSLRASCYRDLGLKEEESKERKLLKEYVEKSKRFKNNINARTVLLRSSAKEVFDEGRLVEAESLCLKIYNETPFLSTKAVNSYMLSKIYEGLNRPEEAKKYRDFALENGKELYFAKKDKQ